MNNFIAILALACAASSAPTLSRRDECQKAYKTCIADGSPEVVCSCDLTACLGEDNVRNREYCASGIITLAETPTSIPGGCNPAHPGSCPSSYFTYTTATPTADARFTSISGIPGGCNPAHSGSCPSSYFTYSVATTTATPSAIPSATTLITSTSAASGDAPTYPSPVPVEGEKWSILDLTRYCGEDNTGCDYNFAIKADGKTERCTVIRMPGNNAATESWTNQACTDGSDFTVSWGYVTEPAPPYAVISVVQGKQIAWFGVSDVNGQDVTPSSPFGSGEYGDLGPEQVYTY